MPQVTDPRLTATARLLAALNQQPLRQIEQRRPPVIITPGQPQRALGLLQPPVEQIRTALPQVQGGFLQSRGSGSAAPQPEAAGLIDQAVGLTGKLGVNKFVSEGLGTLAEQLGIPSFGEIGSSIASAFGFGGTPAATGPLFSAGSGLGSVGGGAAASAGVAPTVGGLINAPTLAAGGTASSFGGGAGVLATAGGATNAGSAAGAAAAAPAGAALLPLLPLAAFAIPAIFSLTRGSRTNLKARIGFNRLGRPTVTDADAKGDLTSADADNLGRRAVMALDKVRRELGAKFNPDVGDFGTIGGRPGRFVVTDAGFIGKGDRQTGLTGRFSDLGDATDAFVIGALRSGVLKGDQAKIDAKIRELAPVFKREGTIAENEAPDIGAANNFQQFRPKLNLFLDAIRQVDDPASVLLQPSRSIELVPNPNFVGGPNESEPVFLPPPNPFLRPSEGVLKALPVSIGDRRFRSGRSSGFLQRDLDVAAK